MSHIDFNKWLNGFYEKKNRTSKEMRDVRNIDGQETIQERVGGHERFQKEEVLLSFLRKYPDRSQQISMALAGQKISENKLRMLWDSKSASGSSFGRELEECCQIKFADFMRLVSQVYPSYGREAWEEGTWEVATPRMSKAIKHRVDRLKAIGNGQVPIVAATAWKILTQDL